MRRLLAICAVSISVLGAAIAAPANATDAKPVETGFLNRTVAVDGEAYRYQVYLPWDYDPKETFPIVLALHGYGERGRDGLLQTEVGFAGAIRRYPERFPAIVVFPQTPDIWQGLGARIALAALDRSIREFGADTSRVYLTGMSSGGNGAWYLAYYHPQRFAAMVIVCGWIRERRDGLFPAIPPDTSADPFAAVAERVQRVPVWIFHGSEDDIVPAEESLRMAKALNALGARERYTELQGVNHGAWDPAYSRKDLPEWLFAQRRNGAGR